VFNQNIFNLREEISQNLRVNISVDCRENDVKIIRNLQHFLKLSPKNVEKSQLEMLLSHALVAEKECPGAGMKFLEIFSSEKFLREDEEVKSKLDLTKILEKKNFSKEVFDVLKTIIDVISTKTRVSIKKSKSSKIFVEISEGYRFDANRCIKITDMELKNPRVCCIDGYIESVSEIHHLLTHFSETKQEAILFFRGASDDVFNTIKVNFDRKTLVLIPYIVPFDLNNVNTLVDIAVVSGTDVVSSTKGQMISSIDTSQLGFLETCYLSSTNIVAKNLKTSSRVKLHVDNLRSKMEERLDSQEFISKRISSLSSSCIDINIPDDISFPAVSSQFDEGVRIISSVINKSYMPNRVAKKYYESWASQTSNCEQFLL
jgi:hypothetical protein